MRPVCSLPGIPAYERTVYLTEADLESAGDPLA